VACGIGAWDNGGDCPRRKNSSVAAIQVVQVVRCTRAHDPWGPTSEDEIAIFLKKINIKFCRIQYR